MMKIKERDISSKKRSGALSRSAVGGPFGCCNHWSEGGINDQWVK